MPLFYDTTVNSTRTCQTITQFNGVSTTMDTCTFTLFNPNLHAVVGPLAVTNISPGVYQFAIAPATLNIPGNWSQVWYIQKGTQSLQSSAVIAVGPSPS